jgi:hypothetical protein
MRPCSKKCPCQKRYGQVCGAETSLRVRAKINSQIFSVQAPAQQGAKMQEYLAYSEFLQSRLKRETSGIERDEWTLKM